MIELLVVVAIIALLISILLPSLKEAREQARVAVCQSNLHQLMVGFYTYSEDVRGYLPPLAYAGYGYRGGNYHLPPFWFELVSTYLGHQSIDRFGYNGPVGPGTFGLAEGAIGYMECPSKPKAEPPAPGTPPPEYNYMPQTYGVNYTTIFAYMAPLDAIKDPNADYGYTGSARIEKIPPYVYMVADFNAGCGWYRCSAGTCAEIYNPLAGSWGFNWDSDNDGILDSITPGIWFGCGTYNGFNILHNKTANSLFSDGSVQRIKGSTWAQNEGGIWGDGKFTGKPNPYR